MWAETRADISSVLALRQREGDWPNQALNNTAQQCSSRVVRNRTRRSAVLTARPQQIPQCRWGSHWPARWSSRGASRGRPGPPHPPLPPGPRGTMTRTRGSGDEENHLSQGRVTRGNFPADRALYSCVECNQASLWKRQSTGHVSQGSWVRVPRNIRNFFLGISYNPAYFHLRLQHFMRKRGLNWLWTDSDDKPVSKRIQRVTFENNGGENNWRRNRILQIQVCERKLRLSFRVAR